MTEKDLTATSNSAPILSKSERTAFRIIVDTLQAAGRDNMAKYLKKPGATS